ncbi:MAG: YfiR family protein [Candidatus Thiodiazotropha sp. (ex Troendleina suluensis)]|nr:YfiR family protein [Candidatus Thiodiazotropha sp. (ex Troendleina suluensis)]
MEGKQALSSFRKRIETVATRLFIFIVFWTLSIAWPIAIAQDLQQEENLLKAVFIYNFAKFTRWPEAIGNEGNSPLNICSLGSDELVSELERLSGRNIKGHPVTIESKKDKKNLQNCHVLYLAHSLQQQYIKIIKSLAEKPILTISELPDFARSGGIIELYHKEGRISFIINLHIARKAGLDFSSRLLNLAEIVGQEE